MTEILGHMMWWKVAGDADLTHDDLGSLLAGAKLPAKALPVDVFRRLTTSARLTFPLETHTLEVYLAQVESKNNSMLVRHMVGEVKNGQGVTQAIRKIGDVAFYKPPRGQHSKSRMRVLPGSDPYPTQATEFAQHLRAEYDRAIKGALDSQAIRRVVRAHLAAQGAVYLDGPYFVENTDQCEGLRALFNALGGGSFMHTVPVLDSPEQREFIAQHSQEVAA